jgi:Protein of unknown function (DUF1501)
MREKAMISIEGAPRTFCDGSSRREFLRLGAIGALGLSMPAILRASTASSGTLGFGRARRCILLVPMGGPSQFETWDPKPDAPVGVRGEFKPIATNVPGIQLGEHFPLLARQADKLCILRAVTHGDAVHTSAAYTMLTGSYHPQPNVASAKDIRPTANDHPHLGSIVSRFRGWRDGLPPFVAMPEYIREANMFDLPGQDAGFLGKAHDPLLVGSDARKRALEPLQIALPPGLTADRLADRRALRDRLTRRLDLAEASAAARGLDPFEQQAYDLLGSRAARQAFDLDREPGHVRDAYGRHLFGQGCLLARRLVEAGVSLVTVYWHYEGPEDSPVWDTHENNFRHLKERLMPPADRAFATLLSELDGRGLLDETLVVWMGEFGRSPRINAKAGREHWPHVQSVVLAGAGLRGGSLYGASDRLGGHPVDSPVTPPDLAATLLHLLGIRPEAELRDRTGRPLRASEGNPIRDLL